MGIQEIYDFCEDGGIEHFSFSLEHVCNVSLPKVWKSKRKVNISPSFCFFQVASNVETSVGVSLKSQLRRLQHACPTHAGATRSDQERPGAMEKKKMCYARGREAGWRPVGGLLEAQGAICGRLLGAF